jgi:hypothetical protein
MREGGGRGGEGSHTFCSHVHTFVYAQGLAVDDPVKELARAAYSAYWWNQSTLALSGPPGTGSTGNGLALVVLPTLLDVLVPPETSSGAFVLQVWLSTLSYSSKDEHLKVLTLSINLLIFHLSQYPPYADPFFI